MVATAPTAPARTWAGHARALLRLGLPLVGSHLAQFAVQLTDTVMLGWYDVEALAAVVLGAGVFFVVFIMGSGFAFAVSPVVAAAEATGDTAQARRVTRMGMWLSVLFAACVMPGLIFAEPVLRLFGQSPEVAAGAGAYLRVAGWGLVPALLVMVLKSYLSALERVRAVLLATLGGAALNAVLNWALIFGHWGAPEMGIVGAAIASVVLHLAMLVALALHAARALPEHELFVRMWRPDREAFLRMFRLGWPIGLTNLAEVGLFSASSLMVGWIGTVQLAAHGIALQLAAAAFLVHVGLSNAAQIRAGAAYGRGDEDALRRGGAVALAVSAVVATAAVALFLGLPETLIGLFLDPSDPARPEVLAAGVGLLALAALFQFADAAQVMALGLLRGVQDTRVPMVHAVVSYWAVGMPACYGFGFVAGMGAPGVWIGLTLGLALAAALLMARFWRHSVRLRPAPAA